MKQVAKLVIIDNDDKYLMMYRSNHPRFGVDSDLPGGTLEEGEQPLETMIREVFEEAGITVDQAKVHQVYEGTGYSMHGTRYSLYVTHLDSRPEVTLSWEHSSYKWLDRETFLREAKRAKDTYMHMVCNVLESMDPN